VYRLLEIALLSVPTSTNTSVTQESTRSLLAVNTATIIVQRSESVAPA
jgi:hypothetical protein